MKINPFGHLSYDERMAICPAAVFVFSGKRKSGKDFVANLLQKRLGEDICAILRLSAPLKNEYAKEHGLDFNQLLDSSEYKENFRSDMIKWGEEKRNEDPEYFCRLATSSPAANKQVWIICDARRNSDVKYFKDKFASKVQLVRIKCDESVRKDRGFIFTAGIDDAESECGLDQGIDWDIVIYNNGNNMALENKLALIAEDVKDSLTPRAENSS